MQNTHLQMHRNLTKTRKQRILYIIPVTGKEERKKGEWLIHWHNIIQQRTSKYAIEFILHFVLGIYCWAWSRPLRVVCFPSDTPWRILIFPLCLSVEHSFWVRCGSKRPLLLPLEPHLVHIDRGPKNDINITFGSNVC